MNDDLLLKMLSKTEQWWTERGRPRLHAMSSIGGCLSTIGGCLLRAVVGGLALNLLVLILLWFFSR